MANVDIAIDPGTGGQVPRFKNLPHSLTVSEAVERLALVYTIDAEDPQESDLIVTIVGGNTNDTFAISGDKVIVANELDAEAIAGYNLTIEVKSVASGVGVNSTLAITVGDVNDIPPVRL